MREPAAVLIGLGANLGDPAAQLREAVRRLEALGRVLRVSSAYRTAPVGPVAQPDFLNAACLLETALAPPELLARVLDLERALGRVREVRHGPRTIDIDLLDYAGRVVRSPTLTLPHPEMARRPFVLVPVAEVAPQWRHPVEGRTAAELLAGLPRADAVERVGVIVAG